MFGFSKRQERPATANDAIVQALAEQHARLTDLGEAMQQLRLEWAETMDKINRWAARQAARDRHSLAKLADGEAGEETAPAALALSPEQQRAEQKRALRASLRARGA